MADTSRTSETAKPSAAATPAVAATDEDSKALPPKAQTTLLDEVKAWVRAELALLQQGHSEETRRVKNP